MKTLEVSHLKHYQDTDLKLMQDCSKWFDPIPDREVTMVGIVDTDKKYPEQYGNKPLGWFTIMYRININETGNSESTNFKPILHPLSDLTKEIEYKGKLHTYNQILERMNVEEIGDYAMIDFSYWLSLANTKIITGGSPYWIMEKLFEWHFDVFGLIKDGLAIDINTLK